MNIKTTSNIDVSKLTPMMQQYFSIKEQYKDCILFFRLGDFYEMFFDDATVASKELEITLTGRVCGQKVKAPMCGVPHHSAENYINKLISKGFKVAICEQVEDANLAKGIVKRDVIRIVTPGTNLNIQTLDETKNNYLMCVYNDKNNYGIAYVDITTGDFYTTQINNHNKLIDEIAKIQPSEIIHTSTFKDNLELIEVLNQRFNTYMAEREDWYYDNKRASEIIKNHFQIKSLDGFGLTNECKAIIATGVLLEYIYDTQKNKLDHITSINLYSTNDYMILDISTRRNLELVETLRDKERKGSLLGVLDKTKTAMGARLLRNYIEQPLLDRDQIEIRLDGVEELKNDIIIREEFKELLNPIYDMERLMGKISCSNVNCRDLIAFKQSLLMLPNIKNVLSQCTSKLFNDIFSEFDDLTDLLVLIDKSIEDDPPISIKEGNIIKRGYNEDIDLLKNACTDGKQWIADLETKERELTGIKNLKIKYNKVFGYYIELTKSNIHMAPDRYTRKQTLANSERYITSELKEMENTILGAQEKVIALEYEVFLDIRSMLAKEVSRIKRTAKHIAVIDVVRSLSDVADKQNYVRPSIATDKVVNIKNGRHPVIEKMMPNDMFISNDTYLDKDKHRFSIITGPNMAGKSTYMRQVALIVLMAQIGSFVPAEEATIGIVDRIFTRVGASDDLATGQSTFMVEMTEVANILRNATRNSLIILDEIGRGTSTFDGLSIAWAVVEYITNTNTIGAKTLFATHYHELTELEGKVDGLQNYCISVKENGDDIIFLRKIIPGGADKSYGIQVAKLAGVPEYVIRRSKEILEELSEADITKRRKNVKIASSNVKSSSEKANKGASTPVQINLFENLGGNSKVVDELKKIDVNSITPMEALNLLDGLKKLVEN